MAAELTAEQKKANTDKGLNEDGTPKVTPTAPTGKSDLEADETDDRLVTAVVDDSVKEPTDYWGDVKALELDLSLRPVNVTVVDSDGKASDAVAVKVLASMAEALAAYHKRPKIATDRILFGAHFMYVLYRAAKRGCSEKNKKEGKVGYKVRNVEYILPDRVWLNVLRNYKNSHGITQRQFFRANEKLYVTTFRDSKLFEDTTWAAHHAVPVAYSWLSADFLTGRADLYSNEEREVIRRSRNNAVNKPGSSSGEIYSLDQLERRN